MRASSNSRRPAPSSDPPGSRPEFQGGFRVHHQPTWRTCLRLRHILIVFATLPMLLFSLMPVAPMSAAFAGPALAMVWSSEA